MFKRLSFFLPDLPKSWLLLIMLAVGGSILGGLVNFLLTLIFPGFAGWGEIITYPLIFIPPFAVIFFSLKISDKEREANPEAAVFSIPVNKAGFGKAGPFLSVILIIPLVFTFNLITEPLTNWMEVPQFFKDFMLQVQSNKVSSFFAIVIFAPLLEELFCRGILLRGLLFHMSPAKAIFWSALMFGIMHLNPWQAIPAFLLGLLMGWIYWRTNSLWSVILIHFVNNGFSFLVTVLYPEVPFDYGFADVIPAGWYLGSYIFSLLFTVGVIYFMNKSYGKIIPVKI
ncbi:MAG: lysostaphin resistance A-like protein [Bacteroidales bacterium]